MSVQPSQYDSSIATNHYSSTASTAAVSSVNNSPIFNSSKTSSERQSSSTSQSLLDPEVEAPSGNMSLIQSILLLTGMQFELMETTSTSRINDLKGSIDRIKSFHEDRIKYIKETAHQMQKAAKSNKIAEIFGWTAGGFGMIASIGLVATAANPVVAIASFVSLCVSMALMIDAQTGNNMVEGLVGKDAKAQMGFHIGIGLVLMAFTGGAAFQAMNTARAASQTAASSSSAANSAASARIANAAAGTGSGVGGAASKAAANTPSLFSKMFSLNNVPVIIFASEMSEALATIGQASARIDSARYTEQSEKLRAKSVRVEAEQQANQTSMDFTQQGLISVVQNMTSIQRTLNSSLEKAYAPYFEIIKRI